MLGGDLFPLPAVAHLLRIILWSSSPQLQRIHRLHRQPESSGLWSIFSYSQRPQKCIWEKNVSIIREYLFWTQLVSSSARQRRNLHTFFHISGKICKDLNSVYPCPSTVDGNMRKFKIWQMSTWNYGELFVLNWHIQTPVNVVGMLVSLHAFLMQPYGRHDNRKNFLSLL